MDNEIKIKALVGDGSDGKLGVLVTLSKDGDTISCTSVEGMEYDYSESLLEQVKNSFDQNQDVLQDVFERAVSKNELLFDLPEISSNNNLNVVEYTLPDHWATALLYGTEGFDVMTEEEIADFEHTMRYLQERNGYESFSAVSMEDDSTFTSVSDVVRAPVPTYENDGSEALDHNGNPIMETPKNFAGDHATFVFYATFPDYTKNFAQEMEDIELKGYAPATVMYKGIDLPIRPISSDKEVIWGNTDEEKHALAEAIKSQKVSDYVRSKTEKFSADNLYVLDRDKVFSPNEIIGEIEDGKMFVFDAVSQIGAVVKRPPFDQSEYMLAKIFGSLEEEKEKAPENKFIIDGATIQPSLLMDDSKLSIISNALKEYNIASRSTIELYDEKLIKAIHTFDPQDFADANISSMNDVKAQYIEYQKAEQQTQEAMDKLLSLGCPPVLYGKRAEMLKPLKSIKEFKELYKDIQKPQFVVDAGGAMNVSFDEKSISLPTPEGKFARAVHAKLWSKSISSGIKNRDAIDTKRKVQLALSGGLRFSELEFSKDEQKKADQALISLWKMEGVYRNDNPYKKDVSLRLNSLLTSSDQKENVEAVKTCIENDIDPTSLDLADEGRRTLLVEAMDIDESFVRKHLKEIATRDEPFSVEITASTLIEVGKDVSFLYGEDPLLSDNETGLKEKIEEAYALCLSEKVKEENAKKREQKATKTKQGMGSPTPK